MESYYTSVERFIPKTQAKSINDCASGHITIAYGGLMVGIETRDETNFAKIISKRSQIITFTIKTRQFWHVPLK